MSASGGSKAIIAAFLANMGIAVAKFIALAASRGPRRCSPRPSTRSPTRGNQLLLLLGGRRAKREADHEHPFGYGRERYVYAFVVSIILFSVGGLFSIYEGVEKITHPHEITMAWVPIAMLVVAIVLESFSLRTAVKESNHVRTKGQSWVSFVRHAKAPELPVVLLEDIGALIGLVFALFGVGLTVITGNPIFDAIGTLMIGTLLIIIAIVLGIETKSLLVGEGATEADHDKIVAVDRRRPDRREAHPHQDALPRPGRAARGREARLRRRSPRSRAVAADIDAIESQIRAAVPTARVIYLEPDIYRPSDGPNPPTEEFVIRSLDWRPEPDDAVLPFHRAAAGRELRRPARLRASGERLGFDGYFRSDHYLRGSDGDPLPGPTDAWTTLAGPRARDLADPPRHAGVVGHLPRAGNPRDPGRAGRRDVGRARRARARRRLVRARAPRLRHPVSGEAVRSARGAARAHHRALGHSGRRDLHASPARTTR